MFIEASSAEISAAAAGHSEADFPVIADDLMFYRSAAHEFLEQQHLPVQTFTGRRPLEFVVHGAVRRLELSGVTTLDAIILYDADREPLIIATNDLESVPRYFAGN